MERSEIRDCFIVCGEPGLRCAPSGLRLLSGLVRVAAMEEILTDSEHSFLASQGLDSDDVMDVRGLPQWLWFRRIEKEGKIVALGSRCRAGGHRLRSRRGHCVQCDTSKLGFQ